MAHVVSNDEHSLRALSSWILRMLFQGRTSRLGECSGTAWKVITRRCLESLNLRKATLKSQRFLALSSYQDILRQLLPPLYLTEKPYKDLSLLYPMKSEDFFARTQSLDHQISTFRFISSYLESKCITSMSSDRLFRRYGAHDLMMTFTPR